MIELDQSTAELRDYCSWKWRVVVDSAASCTTWGSPHLNTEEDRAMFNMPSKTGLWI